MTCARLLKKIKTVVDHPLTNTAVTLLNCAATFGVIYAIDEERGVLASRIMAITCDMFNLASIGEKLVAIGTRHIRLSEDPRVLDCYTKTLLCVPTSGLTILGTLRGMTSFVPLDDIPESTKNNLWIVTSTLSVICGAAGTFFLSGRARKEEQLLAAMSTINEVKNEAKQENDSHYMAIRNG